MPAAPKVEAVKQESLDHQARVASGSLAEPTGRLHAYHDAAYEVVWTTEERAALDTGMTRFPADKCAGVERYIRIAALLPRKGARDVALRIRWLATNPHPAKKRQASDADGSKQRAQQAGRQRGQSIFSIQPSFGSGAANGRPYSSGPGMDEPGSAPGMTSPVAQLLEQNYAILNQFKQNMAQYKVNQNTELLIRYRDNLKAILSQMNAMQGVMQQMPPLPVRMNIELASSFLPQCSTGCSFPVGIPFLPPGVQGMMAPSPPAPFSAPPPASFPMASAPQQAANGPASSGLAPAAQHGIPAPTPRPHSTPVALQPSMPPPPASLLGLSSVPALGMRSMGMPAFPQPPQTFPQPPSSGAQVKQEPESGGLHLVSAPPAQHSMGLITTPAPHALQQQSLQQQQQQSLQRQQQQQPQRPPASQPQEASLALGTGFTLASAYSAPVLTTGPPLLQRAASAAVSRQASDMQRRS